MSNGRVCLSRSDPWTGRNLDRRAAFPQKLHFARFVLVRGQSVARLVGPGRSRTLSTESGTKSQVGASVLKSPRVKKSNRARSLSPEIVEPQEPLLLLPGEGVLLFRAPRRDDWLSMFLAPGWLCAFKSQRRDDRRSRLFPNSTFWNDDWPELSGSRDGCSWERFRRFRWAPEGPSRPPR